MPYAAVAAAFSVRSYLTLSFHSFEEKKTLASHMIPRCKLETTPDHGGRCFRMHRPRHRAEDFQSAVADNQPPKSPAVLLSFGRDRGILKSQFQLKMAADTEAHKGSSELDRSCEGALRVRSLEGAASLLRLLSCFEKKF